MKLFKSGVIVTFLHLTSIIHESVEFIMREDALFGTQSFFSLEFDRNIEVHPLFDFKLGLFLT